MKRIVLLSITLLFVFVSCSKDSPEPTTAEPVLNINGTKLRRVITTYDNRVTSESGDYIYNGDKLSKIVSSSGSYVNYTYTGDVITKIESYRGNVLIDTNILEYNSFNKLITRRQFLNNSGYKVVYTYNLDGTISISGYTGDLINQTTPTNLNKKVFFVNGLLSKIEEYKLINGNMETLFTNYAFDNKNEPYYTILGYNKLTFYELGGSYGNPNNLISITYSATNSSMVDVDNINNTYNTFNFLSTSTAVDPYDDGGAPIISQYFYE